mgnify:FL=1
MKKLTKSWKKKVKRLDIWDIGMIKWSSIIFGVIIGAYISGWAQDNVLYLVIAVILLAIKPSYDMLKK